MTWFMADVQVWLVSSLLYIPIDWWVGPRCWRCGAGRRFRTCTNGKTTYMKGKSMAIPIPSIQPYTLTLVAFGL
jgi:hypothetical protein